MYKLVNKFGNVYKNAKNERERDELLNSGFKLVEEKAPETNPDKMTVDQLKAYAAEHNIDLKDCKNKADMLERVKAAATE